MTHSHSLEPDLVKLSKEFCNGVMGSEMVLQITISDESLLDALNV